MFYSIKKVSNSACPCSDSSLCNPITTTPEKEVFGFTNPNPKYVPYYNWTYITTIAYGETNDSTLMCSAHSNNARAILWPPGDYPLTPNKTERQQWIIEKYNYISSNYLDGITFDYESPLNSNDIKNTYYIQLINETTNYFHTKQAFSQISVCVAWAPYGIDGRNYDYLTLSEVSDYLYIMDYDTQSQIMDSCIASANSPITKTKIGIEGYLELGINPSKLILGIPWYGYNYTCDMNEIESKTSKYCPIPFIPFRGINCSDAAGGEVSYAKMYDVILDNNYNITNIRWDKNMKSPYFNYMLPNSENPNQIFQFWFDNKMSLENKYSMAKEYNLKGIGPFTFSEVYYNFSSNELKRAQEIWSAFDVFFD